jgi:hypothetical protein
MANGYRYGGWSLIVWAGHPLTILIFGGIQRSFSNRSRTGMRSRSITYRRHQSTQPPTRSRRMFSRSHGFSDVRMEAKLHTDRSEDAWTLLGPGAVHQPKSEAQTRMVNPTLVQNAAPTRRAERRIHQGRHAGRFFSMEVGVESSTKGPASVTCDNQSAICTTIKRLMGGQRRSWHVERRGHRKPTIDTST